MNQDFFVPYVPLFARMDALRGKRRLIVIDGMAGAGKTCAADMLAARLDAQILHMDDFFLPPPLRTAQRLAEPGGNVHYERFTEEALCAIARGGAFGYRRYDCHDDAFYPEIIESWHTLIIEGTYSMHPKFAQTYDKLGAITVFLHVTPEEQARRLIAREGNERYCVFRDRWIPLENLYFDKLRVREKAFLAL